MLNFAGHCMEMTLQTLSHADSIATRTRDLFKEKQQRIAQYTDSLFARLMLCQWIAGIAAALWISPRTWSGTQSRIHFHVWAAVLFGGLVTSVPVLLALTQSGKAMTRHAIAIGQM